MGITCQRCKLDTPKYWMYDDEFCADCQYLNDEEEGLFASPDDQSNEFGKLVALIIGLPVGFAIIWSIYEWLMIP